MPTLRVPTAEDISKKWGDVTPGRADYYRTNASVAGADWESGALAAVPIWKAAMAQAGIDKRLEGGIRKAGSAKFERKIKDVGADRFGPGVTAAIPDMKAGIGPFRDVLDGLTISERGPRGSDKNYKIVKEVGDALYKKRLALLAAGS
jgi:hypothetical protein